MSLIREKLRLRFFSTRLKFFTLTSPLKCVIVGFNCIFFSFPFSFFRCAVASLLEGVSVRPSVRPSVSIKEKRGLGASYVGHPALFFFFTF